ncbi:MAG TPA: PadR family transcriptional regulator [Burkholderiaceae bacterium]
MPRHHGHRHGPRHEDGFEGGHFDFYGSHEQWHGHQHAQAFGHDSYPGGMWNAGWHFLERLYERMPWLAQVHAMGMGHRGHRDGGRRGWDGMGGDGDGEEFRRGRKLSSMDLQLLLLAMLADKPAHGYELIKAIESLSKGFYAPSPGMVYPALTYLEELGHLLVAQEGNRKSYSLSHTGREHLAQNKERVEAMLSRLAHIGAKMESVRRAYSGEAGTDFGEGGWLPELIDAKRKLKHALFEHDDMSPAEQKRIAQILLQAAKSIKDD